MTVDQTQETAGRLRKLNIDIVTGALSAIGALLVVTEAKTWWDALLLGVGLAAALVVVNRWTVGRFSRVALPGLIVTATVWLVGVLAADASAASYGFAVVASITILEAPRHRRTVIATITAFAATVIAAKLVMGREDILDVLLRYVLVSLCVALAGIVLTILVSAMHDLIGELDSAREREAEMAVMRERVRFAGDLHDIQGHTLHVVKLKVALATKLLRRDIDKAEHELNEVHTLVGDTITQTRELAYAQRRLNLSAELENAKNLFEAAGIDVRVDRAADAEAHADALLGQVLREATTNIMRHAEATQVWITLSPTGISVLNDGAPQGRVPSLSGLAALRDRLTDQGGDLTVDQADGRFRTAATLPRPTSQATSTTQRDDR